MSPASPWPATRDLLGLRSAPRPRDNTSRPHGDERTNTYGRADGRRAEDHSLGAALVPRGLRPRRGRHSPIRQSTARETALRRALLRVVDRPAAALVACRIQDDAGRAARAAARAPRGRRLDLA